MVRKKKGEPTCSEVKSVLAGLDRRNLVEPAGDLYRLSAENRDFLRARFGAGQDGLAPYKKIIKECMYPNVSRDEPIQIAKAKRAIDRTLRLAPERRAKFRDRLQKIMTSSSGIGWGYYDELRHDFYDAFPEDE